MSADVELMFCDETDVKRPSGAEFFLYGGLVVPGVKFAAVCDLVAHARNSVGLLPNEPLKFSARARPSRVDMASWTNAKSALMAGLASLDLHVFAIYVHEKIAKQGEKAHWALDGICLAFNRHLASSASQGFVVVDHSKDLNRDDLADVATGTLSVSIFQSQLERVRGIAFGHVEGALPLQAADVVLGSIRYCMEKPSHNVSVELTGALSGFSGLLEQRPWKVKVPTYAKDYADFQSDWRDLGDRFKAGQQPSP